MDDGSAFRWNSCIEWIIRIIQDWKEHFLQMVFPFAHIVLRMQMKQKGTGLQVVNSSWRSFLGEEYQISKMSMSKHDSYSSCFQVGSSDKCN